MIEVFVIINMAVLALGYWLGYISAKEKFEKEVDDLKHRPVEVKLFRPKKFVPVCVEERMPRMDLLYNGRDYQMILEERMNYELLKELKPYITTDTSEDGFTDSLVIRKSLVIIPWEEWANHE